VSSAPLEHFVRLESGLTLFCRDYPVTATTPGSPTILCLAGLTRNMRDFEGLAQHLQQRYRVLTLDLRGRGGSDYDPDWRNYRLEVYVADVVAVLDALRIDQVIIIGTSLGGLIGMFFGAINPERLRGLVLNDIGPELDPTGMDRIARSVGTAAAVDSWEEAARDAQVAHAAVLPDYSRSDWLDFARRIYRQQPDGRIVRDMDPLIGRALREAESSTPDFWGAFRELQRVPILAIRGSLSDLLSEQTLAAMKDLHPTMATALVPSRGHAPTLDEPPSRRAIDDFLEGL